MKTKEELNKLNAEVETLNKKLHELTEEELAFVSGGSQTHDHTSDVDPKVILGPYEFWVASVSEPPAL